MKSSDTRSRFKLKYNTEREDGLPDVINYQNITGDLADSSRTAAVMSNAVKNYIHF